MSIQPSPAGKLFADEKHTTIPGSSMLTDGLQTVSSGIFTVNIQESSGDVRQDPFLNAYKRHYEELRMQYEESCSFQHALEREGLLTFAQLTETELVWAEEKFSRPLAQLETALRDPNVMEKYGMFADIKNKLENLISACREELAYRSECLQKFKTALAQLPQETLYIIQDNLVAKIKSLQKFIDKHGPELHEWQHKYRRAEKTLGSVYGYWDRGYLPGFMQKAFNYGYELFHPLDDPEKMLVEKYNYNLGEVRKLRPQINACRNALDKADAQLNIVRNLIVKNEYYHAQNQQKLIADRLPELNALKVQYANPRNSFERDLFHAVDLTLENQEAVVVTRLAFEPQFCTFVTSMGSKPEVFNNRKDSHLGFSINQYCINTINSMLDAQQQTGSSPFAREAMKTVVRGCTEVAQYAREGEYTKAIRLAEEVYSLANTVEASPEIQTAVYQTIEKQLAVHADEETVIFLPEAVPFKLEDIVDMTTTAAMRLGENSKADRELACKLLVQLAPAIGKGVANGLINLANPFNALLVPLYKIRLAAEVAGFTLRESLNFAQYLHYKMSGQQDTADSMLAKCAEPFKHVAAGWEKLDDAAKVEMISQVVTEIVVGGKVSEICNRFEKSVLDKAAQYVSNPTIAKAIKVVSDFRGNGNPQIAQGVVEDVEKTAREVILPKVKTFEQARNKAFDIIGDALGHDSKPLVGGMEKSAGFGKIVGRISADKKIQWRIDWDPVKGMHIHVDNFRCGKGAKAQEYIIPFEGNEETFISLLKNFNR